MSSDLRDLYQEVILEHAKHPRSFREIALPGRRKADGYNPLCGDRVSVYAVIEDGVLKDVAFQGAGCAISTASASLMTEALRGRSEADVERTFHRFHDLVTGASTSTEELGKLAVFAGVCEYPARVKCATLPWHCLRAALANDHDVVSTE